jgi:hypothetical protein
MVSGRKTGAFMQLYASKSSRLMPRSSAIISRSSPSLNKIVSHPGGIGQTNVGIGVVVAVSCGIDEGVKVGAPGWVVGSGEGVSVDVTGSEAMLVDPSARARDRLPKIMIKETNPARIPASTWRRLDMG